eukprot:scaffold91014_cov15-Prasinocladus_malaysianus.AAC.1
MAQFYRDVREIRFRQMYLALLGILTPPFCSISTYFVLSLNPNQKHLPTAVGFSFLSSFLISSHFSPGQQ